MTNFKHLLHKKSCVVVDGKPKLPTVDDIGFGEIAVNYATDHETISLKNVSGDIVTFSSDEILKAYTDEQVAILSGKVVDDEQVTAKSLEAIQGGTGLNDNLEYTSHSGDTILSGATSLDEADIALSDELQILSGKVDTIDLTPYAKIVYVDEQIESLSGKVIEDEQVVAKGFNNIEASAGLDEHLNYIPDSVDVLLSGATSLFDADELLSNEILSLSGKVIDDEKVIQKAFSAVQSGAGFNENLTYTSDSGDTLLSGATSLFDADSILSNAISKIGTVPSNAVKYVDLYDYANNETINAKIPFIAYLGNGYGLLNNAIASHYIDGYYYRFDCFYHKDDRNEEYIHDIEGGWLYSIWLRNDNDEFVLLGYLNNDDECLVNPALTETVETINDGTFNDWFGYITRVFNENLASEEFNGLMPSSAVTEINKIPVLSGQVIDDEQTVAQALKDIKTSAGFNANLEYVSHSDDTILSGATSLDEADLR